MSICSTFQRLISVVVFCNFLEIIRILHECELRMNKSVPRDIVWHHEVHKEMLNSDPRDNCLSIAYTHVRFI